MRLRCAGLATQSTEKWFCLLVYLDEIIFFFCFVETSFLIHATEQKNKLNMWYRKLAMQIQTEDQMNWFGKL